LDLAGKMIQRLERKLGWVHPLAQEGAAATAPASR
jgi:hypothetical protein